jgi:hypothetical protein
MLWWHSSGAKRHSQGQGRALIFLVPEFTRDALGHERFTLIDRVESNGLGLVGAFHSEQWGVPSRDAEVLRRMAA